jgi:hypothetical protein
MNSTQGGLGQLRQSSMSREGSPDPRQDVSGPSGSDWAFALLAAVASIVAARGLWRGARGAALMAMSAALGIARPKRGAGS